MREDPATEPARRRRAQLRRRKVIGAGHQADNALARAGLGDPDAGVQAAAVGALARSGALSVAEVTTALTSEYVEVRRRAADGALSVGGPGSRSTLEVALIEALGDADPLVVVHAAWFLGERRSRRAVTALVETATTHDDARCREAAVAALGAIGDPEGLSAVMSGLDDKPTVRRRATVALAGFDDPRVEEGLHKSAGDRDWQVRQAADELLDD